MFLHKDASNYKFIEMVGGPLDGKTIPIDKTGESMTVTILVNSDDDIEAGLGNPDEPPRLETLIYAPTNDDDIANDRWRLITPTIHGDTAP